MTDPLTWSINLGRWGGTRYRVHASLALFAAVALLRAAWIKDRPHPTLETLAWLGLLALALAVRQVSQAITSARVGLDRDEVRIWPLGELCGPVLSPSERSYESIRVVLSGMLVNLGLALGLAIGLWILGAQMIFNPFGNAISGGAPWLPKDVVATPFTPVWYLGWFGYLNWVLFAGNLIIALPMDVGKIFRSILSARSKDGLIGPWTAHAMTFLLFAIAIFRWFSHKPGAPELMFLGLLIELMVRMEARMLDEGGFFDEGVFGYDFSQGYTSLEAGSPAVRPYRESALKRWRRRRNELRRQRREAREAADEQRMDQILEKLHREGRAGLTDEEQRFLVRVSVKYRKKVQGP